MDNYKYFLTSNIYYFISMSFSATRPLLRQIENLQSTYNAQSSTWEKVEKNLADRLGEY